MKLKQIVVSLLAIIAITIGCIAVVKPEWIYSETLVTIDENGNEVEVKTHPLIDENFTLIKSYGGYKVGTDKNKRIWFIEMPDGMPCVLYSSRGNNSGSITCDWDYERR